MVAEGIAFSAVRALAAPAALARALTGTGAPTSRRKSGEYLTHAELADRHGAAEEDMDQVEQFAQRHNLMAGRRSAAERSITSQGRLGDLAAAFRAPVAPHHHAAGSCRGRLGELAVPEELRCVPSAGHGRPGERRRAGPRAVQTMIDQVSVDQQCGLAEAAIAAAAGRIDDVDAVGLIRPCPSWAFIPAWRS
jgi:hypothetical protein